jgi:hypothetical protein
MHTIITLFLQMHAMLTHKFAHIHTCIHVASGGHRHTHTCNTWLHTQYLYFIKWTDASHIQLYYYWMNEHIFCGTKQNFWSCSKIATYALFVFIGPRLWDAQLLSNHQSLLIFSQGMPGFHQICSYHSHSHPSHQACSCLSSFFSPGLLSPSACYCHPFHQACSCLSVHQACSCLSFHQACSCLSFHQACSCLSFHQACSCHPFPRVCHCLPEKWFCHAFKILCDFADMK